MPTTSGALSFHASIRRIPPGVVFHLRNQKAKTAIPIAMSQPYWMRPSDMPIGIFVGSGSVAPIESKTFWNCGMIHTSAPMTATTPKQRTMTG